MRYFLDNVDITSSSGPNSFGRKLVKSLSSMGYVQVNNTESPDVQLSFIQASGIYAPLVQRLDGIYFNSAQDWVAMNGPIKATYDRAASIICQSEFNAILTAKYFGPHHHTHVIHNGTDLEAIAKIPPLYEAPPWEGRTIWTCASQWRPHKRLNDNIRYFLEHAGRDELLIIAGKVDSSTLPNDSRIFLVGDIPWETLIALYKRSKYFLHLAFLDHCPNVVVDARACGCQIVCSSSGGTHEIAGRNSVIIEENEVWDMRPLDLYRPPALNFSRKVTTDWNSELDIRVVATKYADVLREACQ